MIRFSAFLVAIALGLLVAGVVSSKLALVYVAIGVSGVALLALAAGAFIKRNELFGKTAPAGPELARPEPLAVPVPPAQPEPQAAPWETTVRAASPWPATPAPPAPSRAGYLPAERTTERTTERPPPRPAERPIERPADVPHRPAAFTPRPPAGPPSPAPGLSASAPTVWQWPADAPATQPLREVPRDIPRQAPVPAADQLPTVRPEPEAPPAQDQPAAKEEPAQGEHDDQPPAEHPTQQLSVAVSTAAESPPAEPEPATASFTKVEPEPEAVTPEPEASVPEPEPAASEPDLAASEPEPAPADPALDLQREVTVVPGVPRYHNPQCLLIRFMGENDLEKTTLGAARETGCTPCRACLPDQPEETTTS